MRVVVSLGSHALRWGIGIHQSRLVVSNEACHFQIYFTLIGDWKVRLTFWKTKRHGNSWLRYQARQSRLLADGHAWVKPSGSCEEFQSRRHPHIRAGRVSGHEHPLHPELPGKGLSSEACIAPPDRSIQSATLPGLWIPAGPLACLSLSEAELRRAAPEFSLSPVPFQLFP